jgi:hypothetical protein
MLKRLIEELYEMAGTCSTGFATRLINTITGFGEISLRISYKDQIISNFTGRMNARIRDMDDLRMQERIMEEIANEASEYNSRKTLLKFMRRNLMSLREELYEEFKGLVTDEEFDFFFHAGVSVYESGGKFV